MLVEHHTKYKEIHGIDETVWITASEHRILHNRLRREGKCNIPAKDLEKISDRAGIRTSKFKEQHKKYVKRFIRRTAFITTLEKNIFVRETIYYNISTGNTTITSRFYGKHGVKLFYVESV